MPEMVINVVGTGGAYADVFQRRTLVEMPQEIPIRVETLDGGIQGGKPSIAFVIELPPSALPSQIFRTGITILAQTSVKLFQLAAAATLGKYGDQTQGALRGIWDPLQGKAELHLSAAMPCPGCHREIASSCKYCPECGAKL